MQKNWGSKIILPDGKNVFFQRFVEPLNPLHPCVAGSHEFRAVRVFDCLFIRTNVPSNGNSHVLTEHSQSRVPEFKATVWLQVRLSFSSFRGPALSSF